MNLEVGCLTTGEKNFIESKDALIYRLRSDIMLHVTLIIFSSIEIMLYFFNCEYDFIKGSFFGFVFSIVIAILDIINILIRVFMRKKYQHAYYGVCIELISLFLHYFVIKIGLFPFNQLFELLAVSIWVITSLVLIYAIIDNIKNDRYNGDSNSIYFFKQQTEDDSNKKQGIVITKYNIINAGIYISVAIGLIVLYFVKRNLFNESGDIRKDFAIVPLILGIFILCYIINHGWKLIVKQVYVNRYIKENQVN